MIKTKMMIVIWFLLLIASSNAKADVIMDTSNFYPVQNETYMVNDTTRHFSQILIPLFPDDTYIVFNSTGFNITATNDIMIYLDYINTSIVNADAGDLVLEICADTTSGNVEFKINGFKSSTQYTVKRNGTTIAAPTSNTSGELTFTNDVWSRKVFEIFEFQYQPPSVWTERYATWYTGGNSTLRWNEQYSYWFTGRNYSVNVSPVIQSVYPEHNSSRINLSIKCNATIFDRDGDTMNIRFYSNSSGVWMLEQTNLSVINGTYNWTYANASEYATTYWWNVSLHDGIQFTNATYNFTTIPQPTTRLDIKETKVKISFEALVLLVILAVLLIVAVATTKSKIRKFLGERKSSMNKVMDRSYHAKKGGQMNKDMANRSMAKEQKRRSVARILARGNFRRRR